MADEEKKRRRTVKKPDEPAQANAGKPNLKVVAAKPGKAAGSVTLRGTGLRVKDLIDMVAEKTGGKKAALKGTVEATLEALGVALATGKDLNIPPLGKLRVAKNKPPVMTLKLRLADGPKAAGLALADEDEDS